MPAFNVEKLVKKLGLRKLSSWFTKLSPRERMLVLVAGVGVTGFLLFMTGEAFVEQLDDYERITAVRTQAYRDISMLLPRYQNLSQRLEKLKASFAESQMTFAQVTAGLEKIVRTALGDEINYDLDKSRKAEPFGEEFEKQDIVLKVKSITLDQLVRLLYELEHGDTPLFMGKVDLRTNKRDKTFQAQLEITTIGKLGT